MKKVLFATLLAGIAGAGVWGVSAQNEKLDPDSLIARNIEALGQGENGGAICTGPKERTTLGVFGPIICKCENPNPCRDKEGCN